jgi:hypothetical protein
MEFDYSDYGLTPETRCALCGETAQEIREEYGNEAVEHGTWSDKLDGWVCAPCIEGEESHPHGTVLIHDPRRRVVEEYVVMAHEDELSTARVEDEEDLDSPEFEYEGIAEEPCPIQFEWHSTDPWRGYYEPKGEGWAHVHEDCILTWSRDAEELKKFHEAAKRILWRAGIPFAVAFGTTSNLFSAGYDILVRKKDAAVASALLGILAARYRDSERFALTALTGKSEGHDGGDRLLLEAYRRLRAGEDPAEVERDILRRAAGDG